MTITPKFKINDLVQHKYQRFQAKKETCFAMEVIYIATETCSAGTQIFYHCRLFYPVMEGFGDKKIVDVGFDLRHPSEIKIREDELKPCPQEVVDIILGSVPL